MKTAPRSNALLLAAAFVACAVAIGIPYFGLPYSQMSLPNALYGYGLGLVFVLALVLRATGTAGVPATAGVLAMAAPAVVMARVARDVSAYPTSHNLWPFELVIAIAVGGVVATAGALSGALVHRLVRP